MKKSRKKKQRKKFDMHRGVYVLPNFVTSMNLFFGFHALIAAMNANFAWAAICVLIAGVLDNLDGKIARATNTTSRFGVEYDSLADLVSFGLAPGIIVYLWALQPLGRLGWVAAFLFVVCGALRLARFNTQAAVVSSAYFIGLPIPAAAGMVVTTVLFYDKLGLSLHVEQAGSPHLYIMLAMVFTLSFLMVSPIKYNSFKKPEMLRNKNFHALVLAILILALITVNPPVTLFLIGVTYILSGPVTAIYRVIRPLPEKPADEEVHKTV